jgi:hypothetical protein
VENLFTVDCEELDDLLAVLEEGKPIIVILFHPELRKISRIPLK